MTSYLAVVPRDVGDTPGPPDDRIKGGPPGEV